MRYLEKHEISEISGAGLQDLIGQTHMPSVVGAGVVAGLMNIAFNAKFLVLIAAGIGGAGYLAYRYGSGWMQGASTVVDSIETVVSDAVDGLSGSVGE